MQPEEKLIILNTAMNKTVSEICDVPKTQEESKADVLMFWKILQTSVNQFDMPREDMLHFISCIYDTRDIVDEDVLINKIQEYMDTMPSRLLKIAEEEDKEENGIQESVTQSN